MISSNDERVISVNNSIVFHRNCTIFVFLLVAVIVSVLVLIPSATPLMAHNKDRVLTENRKILAEVNQVGKDGETALIVAARHGHSQTVQAILSEMKKAGATPVQVLAALNQADRNGVTALMHAARHGHTQTVLAILIEMKKAGATSAQIVNVFIAWLL